MSPTSTRPLLGIDLAGVIIECIVMHRPDVESAGMVGSLRLAHARIH